MTPLLLHTALFFSTASLLILRRRLLSCMCSYLRLRDLPLFCRRSWCEGLLCMMSLKCMTQLLSHVGPPGVAVIPAHPASSEDEVTVSRYDKRASLSPGRLLRVSLHSPAHPRLHCLYPIVVSVRGKCPSILLGTNEPANLLGILRRFFGLIRGSEIGRAHV